MPPRSLLAAAIVCLSPGTAPAAMPGVGGGYGAIDAPRQTSPLELGRLFCDGRQTGDMSAVAAFFSPQLARLLAGRESDSVPWQDRPDRPESCTPEVVNGIDDTIAVLVRLTYSSGAGRWSDTLNIERTPDSWWINNVFFESGGNLRFRLFQPD